MLSESIALLNGTLGQQFGAVRRCPIPGVYKPFLPGKQASHYSPIGTLVAGLPQNVCEGWATGRTMRESIGAAISCAMNAGDVVPAAQYLYRQHPDAELIAGDNHGHTNANLGGNAVVRAADTYNVGSVSPAWPDGAPPGLTNSNALRPWLETGV